MKFNKLKIFITILMVSLGLLVSCEDDSSTSNQLNNNFVGFEKIPAAVGVNEGETITVEANVFASKVSNEDRVLELEVITTSNYNTENPLVTPPGVTVSSSDYSDFFDIPATVTIPAGSTKGTFNVTVTENGIGTGKRLVVGLKPKEGVDISSSFIGTKENGGVSYEALTDRLVINAKLICSQNPFRIQIVTDRYGSETTWELYDSELTIIAEGGPYTDLSANGTSAKAPVDLCLPNGNYTFVVYDQYSDGMDSGYGAGYYRLVKMNSDFSSDVFEIAKNGVFGANEVVEFSFP
jgi:hypothetical protein